MEQSSGGHPGGDQSADRPGDAAGQPAAGTPTGAADQRTTAGQVKAGQQATDRIVDLLAWRRAQAASAAAASSQSQSASTAQGQTPQPPQSQSLVEQALRHAAATQSAASQSTTTQSTTTQSTATQSGGTQPAATRSAAILAFPSAERTTPALSQRIVPIIGDQDLRAMLFERLREAEHDFEHHLDRLMQVTPLPAFDNSGARGDRHHLNPASRHETRTSNLRTGNMPAGNIQAGNSWLDHPTPAALGRSRGEMGEVDLPAGPLDPAGWLDAERREAEFADHERVHPGRDARGISPEDFSPENFSPENFSRDVFAHNGLRSGDFPGGDLSGGDLPGDGFLGDDFSDDVFSTRHLKPPRFTDIDLDDGLMSDADFAGDMFLDPSSAPRRLSLSPEPGQAVTPSVMRRSQDEWRMRADRAVPMTDHVDFTAGPVISFAAARQTMRRQQRWGLDWLIAHVEAELTDARTFQHILADMQEELDTLENSVKQLRHSLPAASSATDIAALSANGQQIVGQAGAGQMGTGQAGTRHSCDITGRPRT